MFRKCQFCGKVFFSVDDAYTCDECADKMVIKYTKKDFITTDWLSKKNNKKWKKMYSESEKRILSKCQGCNYGKK